MSTDNMNTLLRSVWTVISNPTSETQSSKLNKFWKVFASLNLDEDEIENVQLQVQNNRTPTPNLLTRSYFVPYNENLEDQIAERERLRSLSRSSSYYSRSVLNSEVNTILTKNKKRRKKSGHNWTRRKGAKSQPRSTTSSSYGTRKSVPKRKNSTPYSDYSYSNNHSSERISRTTIQSNLSLRKRSSGSRTRSISRLQEEEDRLKYDLIFCKVENCNMYCDDVNTMNQHNIDMHQMPSRYYCQECHEVFTSNELLKLHKAIHDSSSFYCLMCGEEQNNSRELQQHLDEHMIYTVPCKYCDKSFLNKSLREKHVKSYHQGRCKRRAHNEKLILDRIDKSDEEESEAHLNTAKQSRYFYYTDMEYEEGT